MKCIKQENCGCTCKHVWQIFNQFEINVEMIYELSTSKEKSGSSWNSKFVKMYFTFCRSSCQTNCHDAFFSNLFCSKSTFHVFRDTPLPEWTELTQVFLFPRFLNRTSFLWMSFYEVHSTTRQDKKEIGRKSNPSRLIWRELRIPLGPGLCHRDMEEYEVAFQTVKD